MRVACLRVPDLPLAAELRAHPDLAGEPFGVASGPGPRAELVSVSPAAARVGVLRLSSVAQARAACAELRVCVASPALEAASRAALLDVALGFSPRAALAPRTSGVYAAEAAVHLDATGITSLFQSEQGFATALGARARSVGLPGDVAVARSRSVSLLAARRLGAERSPLAEGRVRVLPAEGETEFLAPLPLDLLDPDDALAESLTRFGVRTVRELLALPRRATASRLGEEVLALLALARGEQTESPLPVAEAPPLAEALDLEFPVERLEPLAFVLRGLLSRLLARLEARHLACGDLALTLDLDGGGRDARRVGVAAPTLDHRVLLRLVCHALEAHAPEAPVESVRIETRGCEVRSDQLDLFRPAGPAPAALGCTLTELESLCGVGRVGAPEVADDHRPEAFGMHPFDPRGRVSGAPSGCREPREHASTRVDEHASARVNRMSLAVRALRPPVAAEVRVERGVPVRVRSAVANGRVLHAAGPWRTSGGWWSREGRFAYECFDVQTSDGTVSRLRLDHLARRWQIDAVYD